MTGVSCLLITLSLVAQPAGAVVQGSNSGSLLAMDESAMKNRPVTKVITLLKDMIKQLEKEAEEDQAIYDNLACWCETNDKDKTKSIKDAEDKIEDLGARIKHLTAMSARLNSEIESLKEEVSKNKAALDKATALREKQLKEFNAEEKDLQASISALKAAVSVLSKHQGGASLLQLPPSSLHGIATTVQRAMEQHASLLKGVLSHRQRRAVAAFVQASDYFDAAPTFKQSYAPQSGEIFGILTQMQETFEKNLADAQAEETANQKAYEDLKAAKEAEIAAGLEQIDTKTEELAATDEKNAHAKEDLEATRKSLSADEQFLLMLKEKCSVTDKEWEERQKTRQEEMTAVSKALSVLSGENAQDLFSRTLDASLMQRASLRSSDRRARAATLLESASRRLHLPRLSTLASKVRLDAFTRVKKAIDDMVAQLLEEKKAEIKQKHFCVKELDENQLQTEEKNRQKEDLTLKIETLEMDIDTLVKAINKLKAEIGEMQVQLKRAGEDREKQNKEFQMTVYDQRATQKLLRAALSALQGFYGEKALLQQGQEPVGPPPPAGFEEYKKNAASGGVMGLIEQIINDAKAMEAEAIKSDDDAQKTYEEFVKDTNNSIEAKSKEIMNKSAEKAQKESDLAEARENKAAVVKDLGELSDYNAELHKSCDYVLKNFEVRQTARDEEVEALRQAKAILSGAKFEEFLQRA